MERIVKGRRLYSPSVYTGLAVFAALSFVFVHHLASITGGKLAASEVQSLDGHPSWHSIWQNQLYAPYFALIRLVHYASQTPFYNRIVGATIGLAIAILIYFVLLKWVGWRLATLGSILFGTSSALLHAARIINPAVLQLLTIAALVSWYAWSHRQPRPRHLISWIVGAGILLYTPGVILPIALTGWLNRQSLKVAWLQAGKKQRGLVCVGGVVLLAPLLYYLVFHSLQSHSTQMLLAWLGFDLPLHAAALHDFLHNLLATPVHVFVSGASNAVNGLPRQALLNAPAGFLALLGMYVAIRRFHEGRWRFLIILLVTCWLLTALKGLDAVVLVPLFYIFTTIGLAYLLSEWYSVFPRNPIARGLGMLLIAMVVGLCSWYELRAYFVAWPHNALMQAAFVCDPDASQADCHLLQ